jgi:hypothetical protein
MATMTRFDAGSRALERVRPALDEISEREIIRREPVRQQRVTESSACRESQVWNCLVVSPNVSRRESFAKEAAVGGWTIHRCGRMDVALRLARQRLARLVIVELGSFGNDETSALEGLANHVSKVGGLLLVVCAGADNKEEEVQARQLGAWIYLAGEIPKGGLASLCADARRLVDRSILAGVMRGGFPAEATNSLSGRYS